MVSKAFYEQIEKNNKSLIDMKKIKHKGEEPTDQIETPINSLLTVQTVNQWINNAKQRPAPKMLFDVFWSEGELCLMYADTNVGKSILAVQIADKISRGQNIDSLRVEVEPQPVIYFDFELSDKQFEAR